MIPEAVCTKLRGRADARTGDAAAAARGAAVFAAALPRVAAVAVLPDLASLIEHGGRECQQDAVRTVPNPDGSWVIAVADGTGGGVNAEEVAPAAVAALPGRIASDEEMTAAFAAANLAARRLGTTESRARLDEDLPAGWTGDPDTTLAVAAWTPEGGLVAAWVGDSVVVVVPAQRGRCWYGRPQRIRAGNRLIGEFAASGEAARESLRGTIRRLSDDMGGDEVDRLVAGGAIVAVLSDGAYSGYMGLESGPPWLEGWREGGDPDVSMLAVLLSEQARHSAARAAGALMREARRVGLHDNASVAVAHMSGLS